MIADRTDHRHRQKVSSKRGDLERFKDTRHPRAPGCWRRRPLASRRRPSRKKVDSGWGRFCAEVEKQGLRRTKLQTGVLENPTGSSARGASQTTLLDRKQTARRLSIGPSSRGRAGLAATIRDRRRRHRHVTLRLKSGFPSAPGRAATIAFTGYRLATRKSSGVQESTYSHLRQPTSLSVGPLFNCIEDNPGGSRS